MRFLECDPEIPGAPAAESILSIDPVPGGYRIRAAGADVEDVNSVRSLIDRLHAKLLVHSLAARPRAGVLHAALLRCRGRRVLIAGTQGAGKTTLALHLLRAGYDLEGDEHVFLEQDSVIARPRACRVKQSSLALLPPQVAGVISSAPSYEEDAGHRVFNVDPRTVGGPWRIEAGDVACVILLDPKHTGRSALKPASPLVLAHALLSEMGLRELGRGASIGAVAALMSRARAFELSLGEHQSALECVRCALDSVCP